MKFLAILCSVMVQLAFAVPEKNFQESFQNEVSPYFAGAHQRVFINSQGMKLNYLSLVSSKNKKTMVILPGRSEPAIKYAEFIFDLRNEGFNIFILDHQGQGASERLLADSQKGHVRFFSDYKKDLAAWINEVVLPESENHYRVVVAHSMGGAIATLYLAHNSTVFQKAVLSSPMLEVNTKPYSEPVGRILSRVLVAAFMGANYAPDRGPYIAQDDTFEKNEVTHSEARFNMAKAIFVTMPELVVGGPTNRWVNQSLKATKNIDGLAPKISTPILMFQAGMDLIVKPSRQNAFCAKSSNCTMIKFPNAHHEILQETDAMRDEAIEAILKFI